MLSAGTVEICRHRIKRPGAARLIEGEVLVAEHHVDPDRLGELAPSLSAE
jgi:hypothetical protein